MEKEKKTGINELFSVDKMANKEISGSDIVNLGGRYDF